MMRKITIAIPLAIVEWTCGNAALLPNDATNLNERALMKSPRTRANMDSTTLGKVGPATVKARQGTKSFMSRRAPTAVRSMLDLQSKIDRLQQDLSGGCVDGHTKGGLKTGVNKCMELEEMERTLARLEAEVRQATGKDQIQTDKKPIVRRKGLWTQIDLESNLKEHWFPVEFSKNLAERSVLTFELFDERWVLFMGKDGRAASVEDACFHGACPLSQQGKVVDGEICCSFHGYRFSADGTCTSMPEASSKVEGLQISAMPTAMQDGLIWVYPGAKTPPKIDSGEFTSSEKRASKGFAVHAEMKLDVPVDHGLLLENLLDLAHAPFTHTSTFAKGWPIPDKVAFKTAEVLGGHWSPYPIDMSFGPPCLVSSTIGLAQPGKIERGARQEDCEKHLHQLHVCLPSGAGRTTLLYRMSLDFSGFLKHLPFMDKVWQGVANQVLGEDLVLVLGQQENLVREGSGATWNLPMPYDKLAVRYRRWRNRLMSAPEEKDRTAIMEETHAQPAMPSYAAQPATPSYATPVIR
jgi:chlorophyllide a oxygenase